MNRTVADGVLTIAVAVVWGCFSQSTPALRTHVEQADADTRVAEFLVAHPVTFAPGGVELRQAALSALDSLAMLVAAAPDISLSIEGYANTHPDESLNLELSELRAEAVRVYLALRGVPLPQLRARGYGNPRPIGLPPDSEVQGIYPDVVFRMELP